MIDDREPVGELTATPVRAYLAEIAGLAPSTRKRAVVASFAKRALRHDLLRANPMDRIDTVRVPKNLPLHRFKTRTCGLSRSFFVTARPLGGTR
ncbi:hypothetical protein [Nonomuraea fuscirosea]|uniref:hypothetical protein n=1 Tax=Nonomuraea fuscirosea TaxID=1291556 RepID=UPI00341A428F